MSSDSLCLCGSNIDKEQCCAQLHSGARSAATAEALMRSRFTAYAQHNESYLLETWDSGKRPDGIDFSKEGDVEWTRLEIVGKKKGGEKDSKGIVEFKAYYTLEGEEYAMHEISRFVKKAGRWLYLDGMVKSVGKVGQQSNQGRNAPCPCGSGKKFKRCCGK
ncbi:YchJ family protein [Methylomarinum sp. Ch1-1]|uniref:YchJ family protein n=1 Tax=Methylomarinum roseum TaxID=3067653 RepID=A0AAU7NWL5_9GAMM|nr:YchJ family protein [Methylomarinum sp. Ch1-1]MDP4522589.1 YchJ family protein [Methylomarinum sp. Ch1-1]